MTEEREAGGERAGEEHLGGCLCGRVRYRIAAAVVTWATVPVERFAFVKGEPAVYRSSDHGARSFCPHCGTQLTFFTTRAPDEVDVTLGSLDRPENHAADRHVWAASRLPWLTLDPELPAHAAGTPPAAGC